ncbi:MAG: DNA double-strand break repair nuclease NurA [Methanoregula sp.]|uniref:DNA double-strand break repair nuclease NurA n=1 Tax=Methanoregula sp. TaxID=2052170 RepID=UPI003BAFD04D
MPTDPLYEDSLAHVLDQIYRQVGDNMVEKFAAQSTLTADDIHPITGTFRGVISAVDGSNVTIAESGGFALAAVRAAHTTFFAGERRSRAITPLRIVTIGPEHENEDYLILMNECFGIIPAKGLKNKDVLRVSAILRDTLEYGVALNQARTLPEGSLLLLDGTFRVTDANHEPVMQEIIQTTQNRGVLIAAIAKRTNAMWGGVHPLLPAMAGLAKKFGMTGPWWIKIDERIPDSPVRDKLGDLYVASFHPSKNVPFRLELPSDTDDQTVKKIMGAIASCADDGRIPGYPYPLLDAHRTVVIDDPLIEHVRQDLMKGFSVRGLNKEMFDMLFGDLHDDFERY